MIPIPSCKLTGRKSQVTAIVAAGLIFVATVSWAESPAAPSSNRLQSVGQLIHHSSASAQIEKSGEEAATALHEEAKKLYERAQEADRSGDAAESKRLLDEATKKMFEAVRLAKPESVVADKKRADFNKRLESLNQLMAAFDRVRKEKGSNAGSFEINGPTHEKLALAKELFEAGKLDEARTALDEAYAMAKTAMGKLHGGDTVVRSLNFATKKDEYKYELDRNDTFRMLLEKLLAEKTDRPELKGQVEPFVEQAAKLRKQAEEQGSSGDYEKGVQTLEESTSQLVRAIRATGLFIPG